MSALGNGTWILGTERACIYAFMNIHDVCIYTYHCANVSAYLSILHRCLHDFRYLLSLSESGTRPQF